MSHLECANADLPRQYGKPEEYRFYKGDPNNDIQPVSKEALIGAIKKCHQTLFNHSNVKEIIGKFGLRRPTPPRSISFIHKHYQQLNHYE
jgi:hypothetical protein